MKWKQVYCGSCGYGYPWPTGEACPRCGGPGAVALIELEEDDPSRTDGDALAAEEIAES